MTGSFQSLFSSVSCSTPWRYEYTADHPIAAYLMKRKSGSGCLTQAPITLFLHSRTALERMWHNLCSWQRHRQLALPLELQR